MQEQLDLILWLLPRIPKKCYRKLHQLALSTGIDFHVLLLKSFTLGLLALETQYRLTTKRCFIWVSIWLQCYFS